MDIHTQSCLSISPCLPSTRLHALSALSLKRIQVMPQNFVLSNSIPVPHPVEPNLLLPCHTGPVLFGLQLLVPLLDPLVRPLLLLLWGCFVSTLNVIRGGPGPGGGRTLFRVPPRRVARNEGLEGFGILRGLPEAVEVTRVRFPRGILEGRVTDAVGFQCRAGLPERACRGGHMERGGRRGDCRGGEEGEQRPSRHVLLGLIA
mmetsp:Transcript_17719/g.51584  ORF Transcript_17719/g.51584 Transcript_17719/m.51584 type:complete len:203 (-) Transcript_17719:199-807(-)